MLRSLRQQMDESEEGSMELNLEGHKWCKMVEMIGLRNSRAYIQKSDNIKKNMCTHAIYG